MADATLDLMATFAPFHRVPARVNRRFALALLDDPLLDALGYPHPPAWQRHAAKVGLRARGAFLRRRPPRMQPRRFVDSPNFRTYPEGFDVERVGTFPPSCPIVM